MERKEPSFAKILLNVLFRGVLLSVFLLVWFGSTLLLALFFKTLFGEEFKILNLVALVASLYFAFLTQQFVFSLNWVCKLWDLITLDVQEKSDDE